VEYEDHYLIVAKDRMNYTFNLSDENKQSFSANKNLVKVIKEFKGSELEGFAYEPVYDYFVSQKTENDFKVYLSDDVSVEEGTGVITYCSGFWRSRFPTG